MGPDTSSGSSAATGPEAGAGAPADGATAPRDAAPAGPEPATRSRRAKLALAAALVLGALLLGRLVPVGAWVEGSRERAEALGALAPALFALVYVAAALCFVPGSVMTLAAGSLFGPWLGTATVSVASTAAATLAFVLARGVLRARVERWAATRPRFRALDAAIAREGWRVVGLLRLSPVMPFSLGNYLFGLTPVRLGPYVLVSWAAMLPGTFLYVSLGAAGADAAGGGEAGAGRTALLVVGVVATLAVTVLLARTARQRLAAVATDPHTPSSAAP